MAYYDGPRFDETSDPDGRILCTGCDRYDTALDQGGERHCTSGWCPDSEWPCEECGEIGCGCATERQWVGEALTRSCYHRSVLPGHVIRDYMRSRNIEHEWQLSVANLVTMLLRVVQGERPASPVQS